MRERHRKAPAAAIFMFATAGGLCNRRQAAVSGAALSSQVNTLRPLEQLFLVIAVLIFVGVLAIVALTGLVLASRRE